jgi:K+-transporting ATPase KdpF subunit
MSAYAHAIVRAWGQNIFEPLVGLAVAIALAAYLVLTLLMPERF